MWNGKMKAFTLSYDDGIESDRKFLEIINRYGLKCTFNLNSEILGTDDSWQCYDLTVKRLPLEGIEELYAGHEIAVHGAKHLAPDSLDDEGLVKEFFQDKENLTKLFGTVPVGMAYAYGNYNDKAIEYLKSIGIRYGRTVEDSGNFDLQKDLMHFKPTCHHKNEHVLEMLDDFISMKPDKPQLFYLWGHSYEFDSENRWDLLEDICKKIAGHDDIFYGTNREVFDL